MTPTIYEAAGGRQAFINLARAWHARCLADPVVSHAFSHGYHPQHTERLAAYWAEALGGPADYTGSMGDESRVVRMHSGNGEHLEMDERAQTCFAQALDDAGFLATLAYAPRSRPTFAGRPRPWLHTRGRQMTCRRDCRWRGGRGTGRCECPEVRDAESRSKTL